MKFDVFNNVEINILDAETRDIKRSVSTHNKATRNMVKGIISFLSGNFTYAHVVEPDETDARKFIPCFIGFGDGGFNGYDSDGVPIIDENWSGYVDYNSTKLVKEIPNSRSRIRRTDNTFVDSDTGKKLSNAGDMDSIIFHCEISPDVLNAKYQDEPVYVSEIGLFPNSVGDNMLACVRTDDFSTTQEYTVKHITPGSEYGTNGNFNGGIVQASVSQETKVVTIPALILQPNDVMSIKWSVTVASIGPNSVLFENKDIKDETGGTVENNFDGDNSQISSVIVIDDQ